MLTIHFQRDLDFSESVVSATEALAVVRGDRLTSLACSGMAEAWSEQDVHDVLLAVGTTRALRRLEFDCNLRAKPKDLMLRARTIEALCRCVGVDADNAVDQLTPRQPSSPSAQARACALEALSVRGDGRLRGARDSLLPLLLSLAGASLRELDVRSNAFGDDGAAALARALQANSALRRLAIDDNGITLVGFRRLLDALGRNFTLVSSGIVIARAMAECARVTSDRPVTACARWRSDIARRRCSTGDTVVQWRRHQRSRRQHVECW
jgi:hypothetical protein